MTKDTARFSLVSCGFGGFTIGGTSIRREKTFSELRNEAQYWMCDARACLVIITRIAGKGGIERDAVWMAARNPGEAWDITIGPEAINALDDDEDC